MGSFIRLLSNKKKKKFNLVRKRRSTNRLVKDSKTASNQV